MQHKYQTRSQTTINTGEASDTPLLLRVITPMTGQAAYPRVPARSQNLSRRTLSQKYFWSMETANMAIALETNHFSQQHFANAVVHPITGKKMEYMALMNDPDLQPLWKRGFSNKAGPRQVAFFKAFATFQAQTHVSLWNSQTYQKRER
jgi:hypothetical protein